MHSCIILIKTFVCKVLLHFLKGAPLLKIRQTTHFEGNFRKTFKHISEYNWFVLFVQVIVDRKIFHVIIMCRYLKNLMMYVILTLHIFLRNTTDVKFEVYSWRLKIELTITLIQLVDLLYIHINLDQWIQCHKLHVNLLVCLFACLFSEALLF